MTPDGVTLDHWFSLFNAFGSGIAGGLVSLLGGYLVYRRSTKTAEKAALFRAKIFVKFYLCMLEKERYTVGFVKRRYEEVGGIVAFQLDEIPLDGDFASGILQPTLVESIAEIVVGLWDLNNHIKLLNLHLRDTYTLKLGGSASPEVLRESVNALFEKFIPQVEELVDAEAKRLMVFQETLERELHS